VVADGWLAFGGELHLGIRGGLAFDGETSIEAEDGLPREDPPTAIQPQAASVNVDEPFFGGVGAKPPHSSETLLHNSYYSSFFLTGGGFEPLTRRF